MAKVLGIGGVFFKAEDPATLAAKFALQPAQIDAAAREAGELARWEGGIQVTG